MLNIKILMEVSFKISNQQGIIDSHFKLLDKYD